MVTHEAATAAQARSNNRVLVSHSSFLSVVSLACSFIEKQKLDSAKMDDDKLRSTYNIDLSNPDSLDSWLAPDIKEALLRDRDAHSKLSEEYEAIMGDRAMLRARVLKIGDDAVYLPVNLKRLIWNAQKRFRVEGSGSSNVRSSLSPTYIIDNLRNMCDRLVVIRGGDDLSKEAQINATLLFKTMLRSTFAAKRVIKDYNLSKDAFTWLLGEIEARFHQALAHPGEMIGSIAAQSIGEPATQMTLVRERATQAQHSSASRSTDAHFCPCPSLFCASFLSEHVPLRRCVVQERDSRSASSARNY